MKSGLNAMPLFLLDDLLKWIPPIILTVFTLYPKKIKMDIITNEWIAMEHLDQIMDIQTVIMDTMEVVKSRNFNFLV
jgi:hypothetical protein